MRDTQGDSGVKDLRTLTNRLKFQTDPPQAETNETFDEKCLVIQSKGIICDPDLLRYWAAKWLDEVCPRESLDRWLLLKKKSRESYLRECGQSGQYADRNLYKATQEVLGKSLLFYRVDNQKNRTASMKFVRGSGSTEEYLIKGLMYDRKLKHYLPVFPDSETYLLTLALRHWSPDSLCLPIRDNLGNPWIAVVPRSKNDNPVGDCLFLALAFTEILAGLVMEAKYKKLENTIQVRAGPEQHPEGMPYGLLYENQNCHMAVALISLHDLVMAGVTPTGSDNPQRAKELHSVLQQLKVGPLSGEALDLVRQLISFVYQEIGYQQDFGETLTKLYNLLYSEETEIKVREYFTCFSCSREWDAEQRSTNLIPLNLPLVPVCNFQQLVTKWSHQEDLVDLNCCQEEASAVTTRSDLLSLPDVIGFTLGRNISFQRNRTQLDLNPEFQVSDITGQIHRFEVITVVYHEGGLYGHYTNSKKNLMNGEWLYYNGGNIRDSAWATVQERSADIVYVSGRKIFRGVPPEVSLKVLTDDIEKRKPGDVSPEVSLKVLTDDLKKEKPGDVFPEVSLKVLTDGTKNKKPGDVPHEVSLKGLTDDLKKKPGGVLSETTLTIDDGQVHNIMNETSGHKRIKYPMFALMVFARLLKQFLLYNDQALQVPLDPWWGDITNRFTSLSQLSLDDPRMIVAWLPTVPFMFPGVKILTYTVIGNKVVMSNFFSCPDSEERRSFQLVQFKPDGQFYPMLPKKKNAPPGSLHVIDEQTKEILFYVIPSMGTSFVSLGALLLLEAAWRRTDDEVGVIPIADPNTFTPPRIPTPSKKVPGIADNYWLCRLILDRLVEKERSVLYREGKDCTSVEQNLGNYFVLIRLAEIFFDFTPTHLHLVLGCGRGRALFVLPCLSTCDLTVLGIERNEETVKECFRMLHDIQTKTKDDTSNPVYPWTNPKMCAFQGDTNSLSNLAGVSSASRFVGGRKKDKEIAEEFTRVSKLLLGGKDMEFFWCYTLRSDAVNKLDMDTSHWRLITVEHMNEEGSKFNATLFINMKRVLGKVIHGVKSSISPVLRQPLRFALSRPRGVGPSPQKSMKEKLRPDPSPRTQFIPEPIEARQRDESKRSIPEPKELFKSPEPKVKSKRAKRERSKSPSKKTREKRSLKQKPFDSPVVSDQEVLTSEALDGCETPCLSPSSALGTPPLGTGTSPADAVGKAPDRSPINAKNPVGSPSPNQFGKSPLFDLLGTSPAKDSGAPGDASSICFLQGQIQDLHELLRKQVQKPVSDSATSVMLTIQSQIQGMQKLLERSSTLLNPADRSTDFEVVKNQLESIKEKLKKKEANDMIEVLKAVATKDDLMAGLEKARLAGLEGAVVDLRADSREVMITMKREQGMQQMFGELIKELVRRPTSPFQQQPSSAGGGHHSPLDPVSTQGHCVQSPNLSTQKRNKQSLSRSHDRGRRDKKRSRSHSVPFRSSKRNLRKSRSRSQSRDRTHRKYRSSLSSSPSCRSRDRGRKFSRSHSRSHSRSRSRSCSRSRSGRRKTHRPSSRKNDRQRQNDRSHHYLRSKENFDKFVRQREGCREVPARSYSDGVSPVAGVPLNDWSSADVAAFLQERHMPTRIVAAFTEAQISGAMLSSLSDQYLRDTLKMEEAHITAFRVAVQCAMSRRR